MAEDTETDDGPEADEDAVRELYAAPPEDFMRLRTELAARAKDAGDPAQAKRIGALRKPTAAAAVVNRLALGDPDSTARLTDVGDQLRAAQQDLDPARLRELTTERRRLVGDLARAAFDLVGQRSPSTALRDEVTATLDAALADPDVAARLGRLTRAEHWSGFGVAATSTPDLTLVRGGRDAKPARSPTGRDEKPRPAKAPADSPADQAPTDQAPTGVSRTEQRRRTRALETARTAFDEAERRLTTAEQDHDQVADKIRSLTGKLAELQRDLDDAKRSQDKARREVKAARSRRREARSALDRAERRATADPD